MPTKILWLTSQTGWSLGNIHFSNNNGSLPFYVNLIYHRQDLCRTWLWATPWLSNKKQALLTLPSTWVRPRFFCEVLDGHLRTVLCSRYMLRVSLDFQFSIATSVLSKVTDLKQYLILILILMYYIYKQMMIINCLYQSFKTWYHHQQHWFNLWQKTIREIM